MGVMVYGNGKSLTPYAASAAIVTGSEPIQKYLPITLGEYFEDTETHAYCSRAIAVNESGLVSLEFADGSVQPIYIQQGHPLWVKAYRVLGTATTASGIRWGY